MVFFSHIGSGPVGPQANLRTNLADAGGRVKVRPFFGLISTTAAAATATSTSASATPASAGATSAGEPTIARGDRFQCAVKLPDLRMVDRSQTEQSGHEHCVCPSSLRCVGEIGRLQFVIFMFQFVEEFFAATSAERSLRQEKHHNQHCDEPHDEKSHRTISPDTDAQLQQPQQPDAAHQQHWPPECRSETRRGF